MSAVSGALALGRRRRAGTPGRRVAGRLAWRAFTDARVRTISFGCLFGVVAYIQPVSYRRAYPSLLDRISFARSFGANKAIRLFYGEPYQLLTVGGYTAWRAGGTLAIFAAVWGLLAAVKALRAEEDARRIELVLATGVSRRGVYLSALAAAAAGIFVLWAVSFVGFLEAALPAGGSAYLALAITSVAPVFVGVGALASQIAPTRRGAVELAAGFLALSFVLRVIADTVSGAGGLRWATPLGWAEELRPFASPRPLLLLLPLVVSAVLLELSMRISSRRDVGAGLLPARDSAAPRLSLLSSATAQALRSELGSLGVWLASIGAFAFIVGVIAKSINAAAIPAGLRSELAKLGSASIVTPKGYLSFTFLFFVLAVCLFVCAQIGSAHSEEASGRAQTILALGVRRRGWLLGRLAIATGGAGTISVTAGVLAWAGAACAGARVSLPAMLGAGANCLPAALLFLGVGALCYAVLPRAGASIAYGLVSVAFLCQLFASLLDVPRWMLDLSPFRHIGLVPAQSFQAGSAAVMIAIGLVAALAAAWTFQRRDLISP
jgi:ABC-2 type transport system permease protein